MKNIKINIGVVILCIVSFVCGSYYNIDAQATEDLQSVGKIITSNPDTGQMEVIFDSADQTKLKAGITANAMEINNLKNDYNNMYNSIGTDLVGNGSLHDKLDLIIANGNISGTTPDCEVLTLSGNYSAKVNYSGTATTTIKLPEGKKYLGAGISGMTFNGVNTSGGCRGDASINYDGENITVTIAIAGNWGSATASGTIFLNVFVVDE